MQIRAATRQDVEAMCDMLFVSINDLHRRHGVPDQEPSDRDWIRDMLHHVLGTDPAGTVVALEGETLTGFASSYRRDRFWFLSFLFVDPGAQGGGIGKALLDEVMPPPDGGATASLVVESFQPVSTGLYATRGMTPRAVRYTLSGLTDPGRLPAGLPSLEVSDALADVPIEEVDALDRGCVGFSRAADHGWWLASGMRSWAYRDQGELVGYAYSDGVFVGPAVGRDESTLCAIVADVLRGVAHPEAMRLPVYGHQAALFTMLLRAGARIEGAYPFVYCSTGDALPPSYVHFAGFMP